jgi:hypothetical protein
MTTGALFASCALSWPIFLSFVTGSDEPRRDDGASLHLVGDAAGRLGAARRYADVR